jgi:thiol-disulfide isomerase/thioredoxin
MSRFLFVFILFILTTCSPVSRESTNIELSKLELVELDGTRVDVATLSGKGVLVNFWATWCKPCIMEMPSLIHLQELMNEEPIEFIFASDEDADQISKFISKRELKAHFVRVKNPETLGIQALPTTLIFNGDGTLVHSEIGYKKWDEPSMLDQMKQLIKSNE